MEWMPLVWLGLFLVALIVEAVSEALLSIWFAAGALVCLGISFIPGCPLWVQIIVFLAVSAIAFLILRPFFSRVLKRKIIRTNSDSLTGSRIVILKDGDSLEPAEASFRGLPWTAIPLKDGMKLTRGMIATIVAIDGNKLIVEPVEKENE